jgi:hypothetical protein
VWQEKKKRMKLETQNAQNTFTLNEIKIADAQRKAKQEGEAYGTMLNIVQNAAAQGDMSGVSIDSTGKMSYSGGKKTIHQGNDLPTKDILVALNKIRENKSPGDNSQSELETQLEGILQSRLTGYSSQGGGSEPKRLGSSKKKTSNFNPGEVREINGKQYRYRGNDEWEELSAQMNSSEM